jgi:hypothetical protein
MGNLLAQKFGHSIHATRREKQIEKGLNNDISSKNKINQF